MQRSYSQSVKIVSDKSHKQAVDLIGSSNFSKVGIGTEPPPWYFTSVSGQDTQQTSIRFGQPSGFAWKEQSMEAIRFADYCSNPEYKRRRF